MLTRRTLLSLATAAILVSAASAETPKAVDRDPFVNGPSAQPTRNVSTIRKYTAPTVTPATNRTVKPNKVTTSDKPVKPLVVVDAPDVSVSGIVASGGQRQAILATNKGSVIAKVGQQLGDYKVKAIDATSVTFEAQGHSFKIPLQQ